MSKKRQLLYPKYYSIRIRKQHQKIAQEKSAETFFNIFSRSKNKYQINKG